MLGLSLANVALAQEAIGDTAATAKTETTEKAADKAPAPLDPGMQIPVDGSSLEAFEKSLATIKEKATEANYISLEGAIDYLLVYDLGAGRDKAKLAKNLDGLTGDQINDKVRWQK